MLSMTVSGIEDHRHGRKLSDAPAIGDTFTIAAVRDCRRPANPSAENDIPFTAVLKLDIYTIQELPYYSTMASMTPQPFRTVDQALRDFTPSQGEDAVHAFLEADRLPPVTAASLQPLSVEGFFNLPNLRYLVNFDMEAHVGPTNDIIHMAKSFSLTKHMAARDKLYWSAVQYELEARAFLAHSQFQTPGGISSRGQSIFEERSRLLCMFVEVRELVLLSVPDPQEICDVLDPDLRMQELIQGTVPSFRKLADWFRSRLLKQCAIKRDDLVNKVCDDMHDLGDHSDAHAVCLVMQALFSILQVVKLDIANHQIKANRARVMQENTTFFQTHFEKRIRLGTFLPSASVIWFGERSPAMPPIMHFVQRTVSSLFQCIPERSSQEVFADSWEYDFGGLNSILGNLETLIAVEICVRRLPSVLAHSGNTSSLEHATEVLRVTLPTVVGEGSWQSAAGNIAIEILQAAGEKQHRHQSMPTPGTSSRITPISYGIPSVSLASGTAPTFSRTITTNCTHASEAPRCDAIGSAADWSARCIHSSMLPLLEMIEYDLREDLNPLSQAFQDHLIAIRNSLFTKLSKAVWRSYQLKPWQLSNMFVGPTQDPQHDRQYTSGARSYAYERGPQPGGPTLDDLVNRLTHILVLHWQWAGPLIYAVGRSGIFDSIHEPGWDVMAGFEQGLDEVPVVKALVYGGPEAAAVLKENGWTGQITVGGSQDNEWWDHRYGKGRITRRRFAHSSDQDEDRNSVGEHASSSGRSRPAAR